MNAISIYPYPFVLTGKREGPEQINYSILDLVEKRVHEKGDLVKVEYYKRKNEETGELEDLAITEEYSYIRNELLTKIETMELVISWYFNNGEVGVTKKLQKVYDDIEGIEAQEKFRQRKVFDAKSFVLDELGAENTADLLGEAEAESRIRLCVQGNSKPLVS